MRSSYAHGLAAGAVLACTVAGASAVFVSAMDAPGERAAAWKRASLLTVGAVLVWVPALNAVHIALH